MKTFVVGMLWTLACLTAIGIYRADTAPELAVITIDGAIDDSMAKYVTERVAAINRDDDIRAVLLVVNSPGGGAFDSSVVYDELGKIKVPVVGWCDSMCASGAVYALSAVSVKYVGLHTTVTAIGSVGVIAKYRREPFENCPPDSCVVEIYKSGAVKQAGAGDHLPTVAEKAALQQEIDVLADVFYAAVVKSRGAHINKEAWADITTARVFFGWKGVEAGLADTVMDRAAAVKKAEELGGAGHLYERQP